MENAIRLLIVEDSEDDAALLLLLLRQAGHAITSERVDSARGLANALNKNWDIVISDHSMPQFTGTEALKMVRASDPDVPFIFVSGTIGEDVATESMRVGAQDFNNMIGAILGWAEMGSGETEPATRLHGRFQKIREQSLRAGKLTAQLLAFAGGQILQPRKVNLNALVQEEMSLLSRIIGADIEVQILVAPDLRVTLADHSQLEQVLMNLCLNARDAMAGGGQLTIETQNVELGTEFCREHAFDRPGSYVLLSVSDTGMGMDTATIEHIFEPFFTTKEMGKGTGLGLATVYGIVKQHGGFIQAS